MSMFVTMEAVRPVMGRSKHQRFQVLPNAARMLVSLRLAEVVPTVVVPPLVSTTLSLPAATKRKPGRPRKLRPI